MKFTVNTKPLVEALNLGILNANVNKFYAKSTMAQISASADGLVINLEAALICSEIRLKGMADSDAPAKVFIDSMKLKQLIGTFEASTTVFEFTDAGLILHSGKSKFTLPKAVDVDLSFEKPNIDVSHPVALDKTAWKFVQDHQMYALALTFITPVYTKAWVGSAGDVLIGDFDNSLFTHSRKSNLGKTCLLSDTVIHLLTSLPDGAKMYQLDSSFVVHAKTDSYEFISEFTPKDESDSDMGSYNADMILAMMSTTSESVEIHVPAVMKVLNQACLLSSKSDDRITLSMENGQITFTDNNIDCKIPVEGVISTPYQLSFQTVNLKSVMSNCAEEKVRICPTYNGEDIVGINVFSDGLTTVLAGVE